MIVTKIDDKVVWLRWFDGARAPDADDEEVEAVHVLIGAAAQGSLGMAKQAAAYVRETFGAREEARRC